ncbi:histidine triad nucleotide-binding protein 3-like [Plectropomus leopardus]|uniref:histidine triad nucleotide-binding protein 3-like n=1 Tax=Plectropomus leopardus TaxID=160734 RepID=UPI001C4B7113|nr:histidine triad nucleotide-binding protein 3-like [Plectropomus leopardus]
MARNSSDSSTESDETCIFCLIANDRDKETEIIKKNKELVCFKDIWPAAPHHYLVVPTQHILSCFSLHRGHISLVKRMAEMGRAVLHERGITDMNDIRLGFHQPPFTSVDHLHLHVLAPASQINKYLKFKFIPRTNNFVTEERLRKRLKDIAPPFKERRRATNTSEENQDEPHGRSVFCVPCWDMTTP